MPKPDAMQGEVFLGDHAAPPALRLRRTRPLRRDRLPLPDGPRRPLPLYPQLHARAPVPPAQRLQGARYPVWNLIKELAAQGKLTPVQAVLAAPHMPPEELYDVVEDPYQIHNLADSSDPEHQAARQRLPRALERWIEESNDQGRTPEPPAVAAAKGATRPGTDPNSGMIPTARKK